MRARKRFAVLAGLATAGLCGAAQAAISFAPAVNYPTGSPMGPGPAAESMITVDVDNDGDADIVAADWYGNGIRTFKNNGLGGFGAAIVTSFGTSTGSVSAADFDFDGRADLAVATGYELIIAKGLGNGSFTEVERHSLPVAGQVQAYAFDANLDGKADIVAPSASGVQTFIGQGNGHFVAGPTTFVAGLLSSTAKANFNHDGVPDIAVADAFGQRVIMLRGNGDGSFTEIGSAFVGAGPEDVTAADLNLDGIDDLATADSFSFTVSVLLSNPAGGWNAAVRYTGVQGPVSVRFADFDRDFDKDLAVSSVLTNRVQVFTNNGFGVFGATPASFTVSNQPQTPCIADYNRDGKLDIATAGPGQMSVLRNTSP